MKIFAVSGAVALLSATMLVAPEMASARPVTGVHAPVIYRAGRLLCYYPFGWRGPGYYPCRRPHIAHVAHKIHFPHPVPVRVREARRSHVVEIRRPRLRSRHAHDGGGHMGHGHGPHPGGGHHMVGGPTGGGGRMTVHQPGGALLHGAHLRSSRIGPDPVSSGYGYPDGPGGHTLRGSPSRAAPLGGMRMGVPTAGAAMGGGMHMGAPVGGRMRTGAPAAGGMHMGPAPAGGGMHVGAPMGGPMGGMHMGAPMAAPAASMHMPATPAMHMPAAPAMPAPAAPPPAVHTPAPAPAGHH